MYLGQIDYKQVYEQGKDIVTGVAKALPGAVQKAVEGEVVRAVTPVAQQVVQAKSERVISKGKVAMLGLGGAAVGALIAGGGAQRRIVGGLVIGALGVAAGIKIGLLTDA